MRLYNERKLSPAIINRILATARVLLNYAFEMGDLETNPGVPVKELKKTPQARGILEIDELRALFSPNALEQVWGGDLRHFIRISYGLSMVGMISTDYHPQNGVVSGLSQFQNVLRTP